WRRSIPKKFSIWVLTQIKFGSILLLSVGDWPRPGTKAGPAGVTSTDWPLGTQAGLELENRVRHSDRLRADRQPDRHHRPLRAGDARPGRRPMVGGAVRDVRRRPDRRGGRLARRRVRGPRRLRARADLRLARVDPPRSPRHRAGGRADPAPKTREVR